MQAFVQKAKQGTEVHAQYNLFAVNIARGSYPRAATVLKEVEGVRGKVADMIGSSRPEHIVFTSGTTDGIRQIVSQWALPNLQNGDEILVCTVDHMVTITPWLRLQELLKSRGISVEVRSYGIRHDGTIDMSAINHGVSDKTRIVVATHINNSIGVENDIATLRHSIGNAPMLVVDLAQSIGHISVESAVRNADFAVFSGHKMFAATGVGVLYVSDRAKATMAARLPDRPFPQCLEDGTLPIGEILTLGAAIDEISAVGVPAIDAHVRTLTTLCVSELVKMGHVTLAVPYADAASRGIVSFQIRGISAADIGFIFSQRGVCLRTGTFCSASSQKKDQVRLSFHAYNTASEVEMAVSIVKQLII